MNAKNDSARDTAWRLLDVVLSIGICALLGVVGFNTRTLIQHGQHLAQIEGNRFSSDDGLEVWQEMSRIKEKIATLPKETPPTWFVDRVVKIEKTLERIERELASRNGN